MLKLDLTVQEMLDILETAPVGVPARTLKRKVNLCLDSREKAKGVVFWPIKGARFDAHKFVSQMEKDGALMSVVNQESVEQNAIKMYAPVDDTTKALLKLAKGYQRLFKLKKVAITGSNGKTTTTELTYSILKKAGYDVAMAGNVGNSLAMLVAGDHDYEYYVLELSSFQLDNMYDFHAHVAVVTNITPDHLDRYGFKMQNYVDSKMRIIRNQGEGDLFVFFVDDPILYDEVKKRKGTFKQKVMVFSLEKEPINGALFPEDDGYMLYSNGYIARANPCIGFQLRGRHNRCNIMAATLACCHVGVPFDKVLEFVKEFAPLEHRVEPCGEVDGVHYVNDSKGTNVDAVWYALDAVGDSVILILGGVDKGNDYSQLYDSVDKKVKAIVAMGIDNAPIHKAFDGRKKIVDVRSMAECIDACRSLATAGDTVLLSPACASFDLFTCYEDRGEQFKAAVQKLMQAD